MWMHICMRWSFKARKQTNSFEKRLLRTSAHIAHSFFYLLSFSALSWIVQKAAHLLFALWCLVFSLCEIVYTVTNAMKELMLHS